MTTPILDLDEWTQSQSQPHVTVNEALRWLECFASLVVLDKDLTSPPGSPSDGDRYIVGDSATDEWAGHDGQIALYMVNAWAFRTAPLGTRAHVLDEGEDYRYTLGSGSSAEWVIIA